MRPAGPSDGTRGLIRRDPPAHPTRPAGPSDATGRRPVGPSSSDVTCRPILRGPAGPLTIDARTHRRECTTLLLHSSSRLLLWNITISKLISALPCSKLQVPLPYSKFSSTLTCRLGCNFRIHPPSTALSVYPLLPPHPGGSISFLCALLAVQQLLPTRPAGLSYPTCGPI